MSDREDAEIGHGNTKANVNELRPSEVGTKAVFADGTTEIIASDLNVEAAKRISEALPNHRFYFCFYAEKGQAPNIVKLLVDGTVEVLDVWNVELALRQFHQNYMKQLNEQAEKVEQARARDAARRIV